MSEEIKIAVDRSGPAAGGSKVRMMTYIAISIALAAVLNLFKYSMPQGGSFSLDMVPIMFISLFLGVIPGMIAGAIYGFVDLMMNPQVFHPAQLILDYPLAFGLVGLAGIAKGRGAPAVGAAVFFAGLLRFSAHLISGVIFFASYAGDQNVWIYSAAYNGPYMFVSTIAAIPIVIVLLKAMKQERGG